MASIWILNGRRLKEYEDYSLAILKMREVLGDKYVFSVSLHPVCYKISKEAIAAVDFISYQCYGPRRFASRWRNTVRIYRWRWLMAFQRKSWWQAFLSMA